MACDISSHLSVKYLCHYLDESALMATIITGLAEVMSCMRIAKNHLNELSGAH